MRFFLYALFFYLVAATTESSFKEVCADLSDLYQNIHDNSKDVLASCIKKKGEVNCHIFNRLFSSEFRKLVQKIFKSLNCDDEQFPGDITGACSMLENAGPFSTKMLNEIFKSARPTALSQIAQETIPALSNLADALLLSQKAALC